MKKLTRFALLSAVLALAMPRATAQTTNIAQRANFVLKGITQTSSGMTTVRIVNKDILAALNASGAYQFGPKATLLFVSSDDQPPVILVRDGSGGQTANTDVGNNFGVAEIGTEVRSRNQSTWWETWRFSFDNNTTNDTAFQLWGSTTIHRGTIHASGFAALTGPQRVESDVNGVGQLQGTVTVFSGKVSAANSTLITTEP